MDNQGVFSADSEVAQDSRSPLSPLMPSLSNIPTKKVRRKTSFVTRVDSSEEVPSPHNSIFEALCSSHRSNEDAFEMVVLRQASAVPNTGAVENNENNKLLGQSDKNPIDDAEFRYGRGTILDTIAEQKSCGTMRTLAARDSILELPDFLFVRHRDSFVINQSSRRKQAFSLDDLALIQPSYHDACEMIEREAHKLLPVHEIYAEPRTPIHAPLERPATPEGMPSWTASQSNSRPPRSTPQDRPRGRLLRIFHKTPKLSVIPALPRSVSDPVRSRQAPRFRPPRSVYGLLEQHPFNSAPVARVAPRPNSLPQLSSIKGKNQIKQRGTIGVRFTPSATARDSEINTLVAATESTSASASPPIQLFDGTPASPAINIKCPHAKGRKVAAVLTHNLNHATTNPPSFEYVIRPSSPNPVMETSYPPTATSPTRPISSLSGTNSNYSGLLMESRLAHMPYISSTAHLMSGALASSQASLLPDEERYMALTEPKKGEAKIEVVECWKCKIKDATKKMNEWKWQSAGLLCFICCGYDVKDGSSRVCL